MQTQFGLAFDFDFDCVAIALNEWTELGGVPESRGKVAKWLGFELQVVWF